MNITIKDTTDVYDVDLWLYNAMRHSRFSLDIEVMSQTKLKLSNVRLQSKKPYCGNHPGPCNIGGKDKTHRYLEGADWVEFNDILNDVLDQYSVNARVQSDICLVRNGQERCIAYLSQHGRGRNAEWQRIGIYENRCGRKSGASDFPEGTPGIYAAIGYAVAG